MKRILLIIVASITLPMTARATELVSDIHRLLIPQNTTTNGVQLPQVLYASDSDGFHTTKITGGLFPWYDTAYHYAGFTYQFGHFSQNGWSSNGNQLGVVTKNIDPKTALGYSINLGLNNQEGHQLVTTDSQWGFRIASHTRAELMLNRDRVETLQGLMQGTHYTMAGADLEQQFTERISGVLMGGVQSFSDGNNRPFIKLRGVYDVIPDYGVTLQLRYRQYHDTDTAEATTYFNPDRYREGMVLLGIRHRYDGWLMTGTAGLGRQWVNSDPSTATKLIEGGVTSPSVHKVFLQARIGYNQSAGYQGPDYSYRYASGELVVPF